MKTARCCLFWIVTCLVVTPAFGVDPSHRMSQYGHASWTLKDGVFPGAPTTIAQTADGYIWIGTRAGLVRFDGVRFTPFTPQAGEELRSSRILSLHATSDGSLWIGTRSDLERWHEGRLIHYADAPGSVMAIREDAQGAVWFARARAPKSNSGALCKVVGDRARCFGAADGVSIAFARDLVMDTHENAWLISDSQLLRWSAASHQTFVPAALSRGDTVDAFISLALGPDDALWIAAAQPGRQLGLLRFANDKWEPVVMPGFDGRTISACALRFDQHGTLWVGTQSEGLYRIHGNSVAHYSSGDGLASNTVENFFEDREGSLWVITPNGVDMFREVPVTSWSTHEGLDADLANGVLATHDGAVWINTWHSLVRLRNGETTFLNRTTGLPGEEIIAALEDRSGRLWIGVDGNLVVYEAGRFTHLTRRDGKPTGPIDAFAEDARGDIWAVAKPEDNPVLMRFHDLKAVEEVPRATVPFAIEHAMVADPTEGVWLPLQNGDLGHYRSGALETVEFHRDGDTPPRARALLALPDGSILAGTSAGLIGWRQGKAFTLTAKNGLPCEQIHSLLADKGGAIWIYATCGLLSISAQEWQQWQRNPRAIVQVRVFDTSDGVLPAQSAFFPSATVARDGTLWFTNATIAQTIDPERVRRNTLAPPVHIERLIADGRTYPIRSGIEVQPLNHDLSIDYTALSFVLPRKVQFRYRLEGHDRNWRDAGTRRQAFYTDLAPGRYRFQVIASNNDGVWNQTGDSLEFVIPPMFYQTGWFAAACLLGAVALAWALIAWRMKRIRLVMLGRLEERLIERERIARELHDTFLQNVQGLVLRFYTVIESLPAGEDGRRMMEQALDSADRVLVEGRDRVAGLRASLEARDDLPQSLREIGEQHEALHGNSFRCTVVGSSRPLHPVPLEELRKIASEALVNAFRHAQAREVSLTMTYTKRELAVRIVDDGVGFDVLAARRASSRHFGLVGMRERAAKIQGRLTITSPPGGGTVVELLVPAAIAFHTETTRKWRHAPTEWWRVVKKHLR
ncbi:MAG: two-component regulator propeller domain-containing protein [Gammaproteobacteria bacterium]